MQRAAEEPRWRGEVKSSPVRRWVHARCRAVAMKKLKKTIAFPRRTWQIDPPTRGMESAKQCSRTRVWRAEVPETSRVDGFTRMNPVPHIRVRQWLKFLE